MNRLSKLLRNRRIKLGLSVKEVAFELKVAESTYRDWENGRRIQGEPYQRLSLVLQIPLPELLGIEQPGVAEIYQEITVIEDQIRTLKKKIMTIV